MCKINSRTLLLAAIALAAVASSAARAEDKDESDAPANLEIGGIVLKAPAGWESVEPSSPRIIKFELHAPAEEGDKAPGRLTVSSAGGEIEANIERWLNQWEQPDGSDSKDAAKIEEKKIKAHTVHLVDIGGTYLDRPFPMAAEATPRDKYRMLAAIIQTKSANVFVKFTGPAKTIEKHAEDFQKMIEDLE